MFLPSFLAAMMMLALSAETLVAVYRFRNINFLFARRMMNRYGKSSATAVMKKMIMVRLYQRLNFINYAVKPFFHCQHLIFWTKMG